MVKVYCHHILVSHEFEAQDLLRALRSGKDFEALAQKNSKCPSAENGGDLGEVPLHRLDPDFAEVLESLEPGEISKPVRTRFGWHLIRRD